MGDEDRMRQEPKIELRRLTVNDAEALFGLVDSNRDTMAGSYSESEQYKSVEETRKDLERSDISYWGMQEGGRLVGNINFTSWPQAPGVGLLGYFVDSKNQGRGVATVAVKRFLENVSPQYQVLLAVVEEKNEASRKVLKKAGFELWAYQDPKDPMLLCMFHPEQVY